MGDLRYQHRYERIQKAADRVTEIRSTDDEDLVQALAHASRERDPYLANVLASELMNRIRLKNAILNQAGEGMYALDGNGCVTFMNPAARAMLGWPLAELEGKPLHEVAYLGAGPGAENPLLAPLRRGDLLHAGEQVYVRRDGSTFPVEHVASAIHRDDELEGAVVVFRDISERKRAEEARAYLAAIVDSSDDAILGLSLDGLILTWNPGAARLYGYGEREAIGKPSTMLFVPEQQPDLDAFLEKARRGKPGRIETRCVAKDGRAFDAAIHVSPVRDAFGRVVGASLISRDVTRRKRSEEKFRSLVEAAPDATVIVDARGRIILINDEAEHVLGYARAELVGKSIETLVPEASRGRHAAQRGEYVEAPRRRAMAQGVDFAVQRKDGTSFPAEISLSPIETEEGTLTSASIRDVSRRRRVEKELAARTATLDALLAMSADGVVACDAGGRVASCNDRASRLLGVQPGEPLAAEWSADGLETCSAGASPLARALRGEPVGDADWLVRPSADARGAWVRVSARALEDGAGAIVGAVLLLRDIGARRLAVASAPFVARAGAKAQPGWEDAVAREAERLRLLESVSRAFAGLDLDPRRALDAIARCVAEAMGDVCVIRLLDESGTRVVPGALHAPDPAEEAAARALELTLPLDAGIAGRVLRTGEPFILSPLTSDRLAGVAPPVVIAAMEALGARSLLVVPLRARGRMLGALGIVRTRPGRQHGAPDVPLLQSVADRAAMALDNARLYADERAARAASERAEASAREARDQMRRLSETLEGRVHERTRELSSANQELEAFSYSVSHDLRAPLRGIDFWAKVLQEEHAARLDDEGRALLGRVRTEAERMGRIIRDLMALSQVTREPLCPTMLDLTAMAREVVEDLQRRTGARVEVEVDEGMRARADAGMMRIALENLLGNAWKYSSKAAAPRVSFGRGGEGTFVVRDNGVGFDNAQASRLFRPFQRLPSGAGFEGTGVGLAIVGRIVERHGGRIWAEGEVGRGAAFSFTLPERERPGSHA